MFSYSRPMKGWVRACFTATAAIELGLLLVVLVLSYRIGINVAVRFVAGMFVRVPLIWLVTCALTGIPAALVIFLSERLRIQSVLFFIFVGGAIGVLIAVLLFRSFISLSPVVCSVCPDAWPVSIIGM